MTFKFLLQKLLPQQYRIDWNWSFCWRTTAERTVSTAKPLNSSWEDRFIMIQSHSPIVWPFMTEVNSLLIFLSHILMQVPQEQVQYGVTHVLKIFSLFLIWQFLLGKKLICDTKSAMTCLLHWTSIYSKRILLILWSRQNSLSRHW